MTVVASRGETSRFTARNESFSCVSRKKPTAPSASATRPRGGRTGAWISSNGPFIGKFESRLASYTNTRHAVATCNGTVALHLALTALGIGPGDEVIVPTLTFVATANAVAYCGATPVFADSERDTWCLSVPSVTRLLTPRQPLRWRRG